MTEKVAGRWPESEEEVNENGDGEERDDDTHESVTMALGMKKLYYKVRKCRVFKYLMS